MNKEHMDGPSPSSLNGLAKCRYHIPNHKSNDLSTKGDEIHDQAEAYIMCDTEPDDDTAKWFGDKIKEMSFGCKWIECEKRLEAKSGPHKGAFGTCDCIWMDAIGDIHIADFKSFSDGTEDYRYQLYGYATLYWRMYPSISGDHVVHLHVLHGLAKKVESFSGSYETFAKIVDEILDTIGTGKPNVCKYCQYCKSIKECSAVNTAITTVNKDNKLFQSYSIPQQLVLCDMAAALGKVIREQAKEIAKKNGGFIESDGIRYEFKTVANPAKVEDLCKVASVCNEENSIIVDGAEVMKMCSCKITHLDRKGNTEEIICDGISQSELLEMCELSKSNLIERLEKKNEKLLKERKLSKKDIQRFADQFYRSEGTMEKFVRVK